MKTLINRELIIKFCVTKKMHAHKIIKFNKYDCEESSITSGNLPLGGDQVSAAAIMRENP